VVDVVVRLAVVRVSFGKVEHGFGDFVANVANFARLVIQSLHALAQIGDVLLGAVDRRLIVVVAIV
jgi:hypothetical protein